MKLQLQTKLLLATVSLLIHPGTVNEANKTSEQRYVGIVL